MVSIGDRATVATVLTRMPPSHKLLKFIRGEFEAEERLGFARTKRIPDSRVAEKLQYYLSLPKTEQAGFADYLAHAAHNHYCAPQKIKNQYATAM